MTTMQQVIDRARLALDDPTKVQFPDARLLAFANAGISRALEIRPDLWFGRYGSPFSPLAANDDFPLPERFVQPVADFVAGRACLRDDKLKDSTMMTTFKLFEQALRT